DLLIAQENEQKARDELQLAQTAVDNNSSEENKQALAIAETAFASAEKLLAQAQRDYEGKYLLQEFYYPVRNDNGITTSREVFAPSEAEIATARAAYELAKANLNDTQNLLDILNGTKTTDDVPASSIASVTEAKIEFDQ